MSAEFPALYHSHIRNPPTELCAFDKEQIITDWVKGASQGGRYPYTVNGLPVSNERPISDNPSCDCRSNVIFYRGVPYDQTPAVKGRLRTRPGNVMYYAGRLAPPFFPGNPRGKYPLTKKDKYTPTTYQYRNMEPMAYTRLGLPFGDTLGYFRFKPDNKVCECRETPMQFLGECCTCEPGEYNPAQYETAECPGRTCCC